MKNLFKFGKISTDIIKEYKNLTYINKPFNDQNTIDKWKSSGHNYEKYTGLMRDQSQELPDWCFNVAKEIQLKNFAITLYCMPPGTIMPEHSDMFVRYREVMNLKTTDDVGRTVVFLEDWKSGHYFEIDETPVVNWKSGDYVVWKNDVPHMAANLGKENRYTMQVTGIYV
jgi:quercetin dioxygenase-like cupin family protein